MRSKVQWPPLLGAPSFSLHCGHHGIVLVHHIAYQAGHGSEIGLVSHKQRLPYLNHLGFDGDEGVKRPRPDEVFNVEPTILKGLEGFSSLRDIASL
jgi:hypothetical protein